MHRSSAMRDQLTVRSCPSLRRPWMQSTRTCAGKVAEHHGHASAVRPLEKEESQVYALRDGRGNSPSNGTRRGVCPQLHNEQVDASNRNSKKHQPPHLASGVRPCLCDQLKQRCPQLHNVQTDASNWNSKKHQPPHLVGGVRPCLRNQVGQRCPQLHNVQTDP